METTEGVVVAALETVVIVVVAAAVVEARVSASRYSGE